MHWTRTTRHRLTQFLAASPPRRVAAAYMGFAVLVLGLFETLGSVLWPGILGSPEQFLTGVVMVVVSGGVVYVLSSALTQERREREAQFERLIEYFPNGGMGIFDRDGRFIEAGGVGFQTLDLEPGDVRGNVPADIFRADIAEEFDHHIEAALEGEERTFELEIQGRYYQLQTGPLETEDGEVTRGVAVATDVTESRERELELAQREQTYRNLVENSPAPINIFDADGEIVWCNQALLDLLGVDSADEVLGRNIYEFIDPLEHESAEAEMDRLMDESESEGPTEFRIRTEDGRQRYIRVMTTVGWYEGTKVGQAVVDDVTVLRKTQEELEENEQRYRTLVEMSPDPILVHRDGVIVYANGAMVDLVEEPEPDALIGNHINEYLDPSEHSDARQTAKRTQRGETYPTRYERTVRTATGRPRYIETTSRAISYEEAPAVMTIIKDVSDRYRHEHILRTLHHRTQAMTRAEGEADITEVAVDTADELLELDGSVFFAFEGDGLQARAWSNGLEDRLDEAQRETLREGILWDAFVTGESILVEDDRRSDRSIDVEPLRGAFVVPVGPHGVILAGSTTSLDLSSSQRDIAHLIAENLEASLDRAGKEAALRTTEERLREQNVTLAEVNRLNDIIRKITQTLIQTATQPEIAEAVCEHFAADESYSAAWIYSRDRSDGTQSMTAWSGMDAEYVDFLELELPGHPIRPLVDAAFEEGRVQVDQQIVTDPEWETHRSDALRLGYRSVAVIPIPVDDLVERVLVIHGREPDRFEAEEQTVLGELGEIIGYALRNVRQIQAIQSDRRVEVDLAIRDPRLFTTLLVNETDLEVEYVGAIEGREDTLRTFLRFEGLDEMDIEATLAEMETVIEMRELGRTNGSGLFQVTVPVPPLIRILQRNDATIRSLEARDGATTLTVQLVSDTDVRTLVEDLSGSYPDTELLARRADAEPIETRERFRDRLLDQLTEKQLDALKTAHYGGFFEWPRVSNSEELAGTRDIAASTFQHHLRAAERKLIGEILDTD